MDTEIRDNKNEATPCQRSALEPSKAIDSPPKSILEEPAFPSDCLKPYGIHSLPSHVTPALIAQIWSDVAVTTDTVRKTCEKHGVNEKIVWRLCHVYPDFDGARKRAYNARGHVLMDECQEIADDDSNDIIESKGLGGDVKKSNGAAVSRAALRIRTRERMAAIYNREYASDPKTTIDNRQVHIHGGGVAPGATASDVRPEAIDQMSLDDLTAYQKTLTKSVREQIRDRRP